MESRSFQRFTPYAAVLGFGLLLMGCSPTIDIRGDMTDPEIVKTIKPGQTTKPIVLELLGSPSTKSLFKDDVWLYIGEITSTYSFFTPTIRERKIVAIHFDATSRVSEVKHYGLKDAEDVDFVSRTTPTKGRELTFLQQLIGNIGRFKDADEQKQE